MKKQGKNHGRWFYTCQNSEPNPRCGFFLWDEDAKPREEAAVLGNSRTEPVAIGGDDRKNTKKRTAGDALLADRVDADEYDAMYSSGRDDDDLIALTDSVERELPRTPSKSHDTYGLLTPATRGTNGRSLPWLKEGDLSVDKSNSAAPISRAIVEGVVVSIDQDATPTPNRYVDMLQSTSGSITQNSGLQKDIVDVLKSHNISLTIATTTELTSVMDRYELKLKGIMRGRDTTRAALRANEAKVVELTNSVQSLEADLEMSRTLIRKLRSQVDAGT